MAKLGIAQCGICRAKSSFCRLLVSVSPMREHLPVLDDDISEEDAAGFRGAS